MKKNFAIILILVLAAALPLTLALSGSLDNARMILRVDIPDGQMAVIHKSLKVNNINEIPIKVDFEPDYGLDTITTFYNKTIYLQPGESADSSFDINLLSGGNYSGKVLIRFSSADPLQKSPPVGLASSITIIANGTLNKYYEEYRTHVATERNASPKLPPPPPNVTKDQLLPDNLERQNGTASIGIGSRFPQNNTAAIDDANDNPANNGNQADAGKKKAKASIDSILLIGIIVIFVMIIILGVLFALVVKRRQAKKAKRKK